MQQIVALTKDYYAEFTKAANSGDTKRLRSLVTPDCTCMNAIRNIEEVWRTGSAKAPDYYRLSDVTFPRTTSPATGVTNAVYTISYSVYLDKAGRVLQRFPSDGKVHTSELHLVRSQGVWKVAGVEVNS